MKNLNERHANLTRELVLETAAELVKTNDVSDISFKKIANHAGMSERTLYRHFTTRSKLMDALATKLHDNLKLPPIPDDVDELMLMPATLYKKLDAKPRLVLAMLNSELYQHVFGSKAQDRLLSIKALLMKTYPDCSEQKLKMTAANIRYYLSASSWHYYRYNYEFDLETTIKCAELAIQQAISGLTKYTDKQVITKQPEVVVQTDRKTSKKDKDRSKQSDENGEKQLEIPGFNVP